ncbi:MAG TPA: MinD/ParA family protein [Alphaproteobacteria bacterium]|nr:MinD/ParA family protein [Alphaproteobacteria bacterium]
MTDPIPLKTEKTVAPSSALQCRNMVAIASGKGGVGKTWFAITLCHALAKRGKHVLLFDGDLGLANVDIQLGLTPERDLGAVIEGTSTLPGAVTKYAEGGFDILAGRSGSGSLATLATQKISDLRNDLIALARGYDYVFVDLGAGVDRSVRQLAGPAAMTYVVTTDEPTSLTDAYAFIKLARASNPSADMRVVVNMAGNTNEGQKTFETIRKACETFLKYNPQLAGIIRRDTKVREAIRAQSPLLVRSPSADAASDVDAIAARLTGG